MSEPETKLARLRACWAQGDHMGALRIAARFHDRSPETMAFKRGWDAYQNPAFYRQLRRDPDALMAAALCALARKFKLPRRDS